MWFPRLGKARVAGKVPLQFDTNVADVYAVFRISFSVLTLAWAT